MKISHCFYYGKVDLVTAKAINMQIIKQELCAIDTPIRIDH